MIPAQLRHCPECGGAWPAGPDFALRGCGWLGGLPRRISPNNGDVEIHDGAHGRDRFLRLEVKSPREKWPMQPGQLIHLRALARQPEWTIRILRGTTRAIDYYRVTRDGVDEHAIRTHAEAVRKAIDMWLRGALWRDAEGVLGDDPSSAPAVGHTHGWARVDGIWTCIQDHYAVGFAPESGCGATWQDPAA